MKWLKFLPSSLIFASKETSQPYEMTRPEGPNGFLATFSKPWAIAVAWLLTIFSVGWSFYTYYATKEAPELTYFVHPAKAAVVRVSQTSGLTVQFEGKKLHADITAAQIAVWNAGRKAIRRSSMLTSLVIKTGGGERILEARLQKTNRDVIGMRVDSSRIASGEIGLDWNILEQNDGGVVQVLYVGNDNVDLKVSAVVEGQPEIMKRGFFSMKTSNAAAAEDYQTKQSLLFAVFNFAIIALGGLQISYGIWSYSRWRKGLTRKAEWGNIIAGTILLVAGANMFYLRAPTPPFGF